MVEAIGVLASLVVFTSFLFKKEINIRIVNIFGAILFVVYGTLIQSFSVWFLNGGLVLVHIYYLFNYFKKR